MNELLKMQITTKARVSLLLKNLWGAVRNITKSECWLRHVWQSMGLSVWRPSVRPSAWNTSDGNLWNLIF